MDVIYFKKKNKERNKFMKIYNKKVKELFELHKNTTDKNINILGKELKDISTSEQFVLVKEYALLAYQKGLLDADAC